MNTQQILNARRTIRATHSTISVPFLHARQANTGTKRSDNDLKDSQQGQTIFFAFNILQVVFKFGHNVYRWLVSRVELRIYADIPADPLTKTSSRLAYGGSVNAIWLALKYSAGIWRL
jgi:hypothetical protein